MKKTASWPNVEKHIHALAAAQSEEQFRMLVKYVLELWDTTGEGDFAKRFKKMYVDGHWGNWLVGAAPRPGVAASKQGIESHHRVQKTLLGKDQLRASMISLLETSVPAIIIKAGEINSREDLETPTYNGRGSVTGPHVQEAQMLLEPESSPSRA